MTPQQKRCLDFIRDHIARHGVSPSYREIAKGLGLKSTAGVSRLVAALIIRGHLYRESEYSARSLAPTQPLHEARQLIDRLDHCPQVYGETRIDPNLHRALRDFLCSASGATRSAA